MFAPSNEAFDAVDPATMKTFNMDVGLLKRVLSFHVVTSVMKSTDFKNELITKTLGGENLRINVYGSGDKVVSRSSCLF